MNTSVNCSEHGAQGAAFVCKHTIDTLHDEVPRGLYWSTDEEGDVNAYCSACEQYRLESGGEWPENYVEVMGIKILCLECFDRAKHINGFGVH